MNELVVRESLSLQTFDEIERLATHYANAGMFKDIKDVSQAVVKITLAKELGISAFAAMSGGLYITSNGQVGLGASTMAGKIKASKQYDYGITDHTNDKCEIDFFRNGELVGTSTYTMDDAKQAGLNSKENWKKHPRNMLFARALSNGAKWYCPDLWSGISVYSMEEAEEIEENLIIEQPPMPTMPEPVIEAEIQPAIPPIGERARSAMITSMINAHGLAGPPVEIAEKINAQIRESEVEGFSPITVKDVIAATS